MDALNEKTECALRRIYKDPSKPGSFGGIEPLLRRARQEGHKVNRKTVKAFLEGENAYTLHGRIIQSKKGVLNERIITSGPFDLWEADLMDAPKGRPQRMGRRQEGVFKYLLTVIDVFSKYAWVEPMKTKTPVEMERVFSKVLSEGIPSNTQLDNLRTDAGTEFFNKRMKKFYIDHGINHYRAQKEPGAAVVERFNRTIGDKLERFTTANLEATQPQLLEALVGIVAAYNDSRHSATKKEPSDLHDAAYDTGRKTIGEILEEVKKDPSAGRAEAEEQMMARYMSATTAGRYKDPNPLDPVDGPRVQDPLHEGTHVRVNIRKNMFEKGRAKNFSDEVWTVKEAGAGGNPNAYRLMDEGGGSDDWQSVPPSIAKTKQKTRNVGDKCTKPPHDNGREK